MRTVALVLVGCLVGMVLGPVLLIAFGRAARGTGGGAISSAKIRTRDHATAILGGADGRTSRVHSQQGDRR